MIAAARDRADREGVGERVASLAGNAERLDFPSAAFDFMVAVQVYLLFPASRRPSPRRRASCGRAAAWSSSTPIGIRACGSPATATGTGVLDARMREFAHAHLPPALPGLLRRAGLALDTVESHRIVELRYERDSFSEGLIAATPRIVTKFGIDVDEANAWADDLRSRTADGEYFFTLNRYLFVARRL